MSPDRQGRSSRPVERPPRRNTGRAIADLRADGYEMVNKDRLMSLFIDLWNDEATFEYLSLTDPEYQATRLAERAMEILRG